MRVASQKDVILHFSNFLSVNPLSMTVGAQVGFSGVSFSAMGALCMSIFVRIRFLNGGRERFDNLNRESSPPQRRPRQENISLIYCTVLRLNVPSGVKQRTSLDPL